MEPALPSAGASLLWLFLVAILPALLALISEKSEGPEKLGWAASSLFFSWIGYFAYRALVVQYRRRGKR